MSQSKANIHGYNVYYENYEDVKEGLNYLGYDLDANEAKTLFDAAKVDGLAEFQDEYARNFSLLYDTSWGSYTITKR